MGGADAGAILPIPWDRLRAWIDEQEAQEKNQRAQQVAAPSISRLQLQALSVLIPLADEEPELDNTDWVSRLMCLTQSRKLSPPVFQDLDAIDVPVAGTFALRWRTVCFLPHLTDRGQFQDGFPAPGFGIDDEEKGIPMFKNKKLSKQYAAKHAHAFLQGAPPSDPFQGQGRRPEQASASASPAGGASLLRSPLSQAISSSPSSGLATSLIASPASNLSPGHHGDNPVSNLSSLAPGSPHASTPSTPAEKSNGDFSNDSGGQSSLARVSFLCGRLGLETPTFQAEEEIDKPGFYAGRAVFRNTAPVPPGLGNVAGVLGKKNAKMESVAQVLAWLEKEERRRANIHEDILRDL